MPKNRHHTSGIDQQHRLDVPCSAAKLKQAFHRLATDANTAALQQTVGAAEPHIRSGHFAIISCNRATLRHIAVLESPCSTEASMYAARIALARTMYASRHPCFFLPPLLPDHGRVDWQKSFNWQGYGMIVVRLQRLALVRRIDQGPDICTENNVFLAQERSGAKLDLRSVADVGHLHAQDSFIYAGPETNHVPKLIELDYRDDLDHPDAGEPLFGKHTDPAHAESLLAQP